MLPLLCVYNVFRSPFRERRYRLFSCVSSFATFPWHLLERQGTSRKNTSLKGDRIGDRFASFWRMRYSDPTFTEPSFPRFDNLLASAKMATSNGKKTQRDIFSFFAKSEPKAAPVAEESEEDSSVEREEEEKKSKEAPAESVAEKRNADGIKSGEKGPKKKKIKGSSLVAFGGHVVGFKSQYLKDHPWLETVKKEDSDEVVGLVCKWCKGHNIKGSKGVWVDEPCRTIRLDKIKSHGDSNSHGLAAECEARARAAAGPGGGDIERALNIQEAIERRAMKGLCEEY